MIMTRRNSYCLTAILLVLGLARLHPGFITLLSLTLVFAALIIRDKISWKNPAIRFALIVASGLIVEFFAWLQNYSLRIEHPPLFHPLLLPDLLLGLPFYFGLAMGWTAVTQKFQFTNREILTLSAVFGVMVEQQGKIFLTFNPLLWIYVACVYLCMTMPAFILIPATGRSAPPRWIKYPAVLIFVTMLVCVNVVIFNKIFAGFMPPKPSVAGI